MDKSEIDSYVKAGEIAREVKEFARELVKPGMKLIDIADAIDAKILELGGDFAFPVNLGLNEIAAHFTPTSDCDIFAEGILKIDLGVVIDGFIADCAISFDLTTNGEFEEMIALNEKILTEASKTVKVGMKVRDVGEAVQNVMDESGENYAVIKSLSGHALGKNTIHTAPTISNYRNDNKKILDNIAFAVEPFVTSGVGDIFEGKGGGIYALKGNGQTRDLDARKVLEFVQENYKTRPFCARWLLRKIRDKELDIVESKLKFVLGMLVRSGILYEYPILIEKSRKPVSQFENTFLIFDGKVICTTG
ncbi:MAG: type II methionyl aminopeptidase [archaeon]